MQTGSKWIVTATSTSQPDLVVTSLTGPSTGTIGGQINISTTIANQGTASAGSFEVGYYLSTDSTITTGDILLSPQCNVAGLAAGTTSSICYGPLVILNNMIQYES